MRKHQLSSETVEFPTGTAFQGNCNGLGMQGFGLYTYPDGTKYLGQFYNNRFHGNGTIEIPWPHCVCFKVMHHHGSLQRIYSMSFSDKLPVKIKFNNDAINFNDWDYCTPKDRRFADEQMEPMEGVGPMKYQSKEGPNPTPLDRNIFDLGFGLFNRRGCLTNIPSHMSRTHEIYVGCPKVRSWIQHNCRHGDLHGIRLDPEILAQFSREILQNNLENERELLAKETKADSSDLTESRESSLSDNAVRLHLDSTSNTSSSKLEDTEKREAAQSCTNCTSRTMQQKSKNKNDVCRIN